MRRESDAASEDEVCPRWQLYQTRNRIPEKASVWRQNRSLKCTILFCLFVVQNAPDLAHNRAIQGMLANPI